MAKAGTENERLTWRFWEMPSRDAQRTCFPEMIVRLRAEWHAGMSMPALIGLRDELDGTLHRIRADRDIQTPLIICSKCGSTGPAAEPRVSVGAGPIRNSVEGSNPSAGKRMGSISQATPTGRRRKSLSRRPGKLPTLKIAGQALPSCEFRMWKAAIHESLGVCTKPLARRTLARGSPPTFSPV
jgi:hypothetical protein